MTPDKPSRLQELELRVRVAWSRGTLKAVVGFVLTILAALGALVVDLERLLPLLVFAILLTVPVDAVRASSAPERFVFVYEYPERFFSPVTNRTVSAPDCRSRSG